MSAFTARVRAAHERLAQHYRDRLRIANQIYQHGGESAAHALALFDHDREQMSLCQAWAATRAYEDAADDVAASLCNSFALDANDLLKLRLDVSEHRAWLEAAVMIARRRGDWRSEAIHLLNLAESSGMMRDLDEADAWARQALALARPMGATALEARAGYLLGNIANYRGAYHEAQERLEQSLALYERLGDQLGKAHTVQQLGLMWQRSYRLPQAESYLEECLAIHRALGNSRQVADALVQLGSWALDGALHTRARAYYEEGLALTRSLTDKEGESFALRCLGWVAIDEGDYRLARDFAEQSLAEAPGPTYVYTRFNALYLSSVTLLLERDLPGARAAGEESLALCRRYKSPWMALFVMSHLVVVYIHMNLRADACACLREAVAIAESWPTSDAHAPVPYAACAAAAFVSSQATQARQAQAAAWLRLVENSPAWETQASVRALAHEARLCLGSSVSPERLDARHIRKKPAQMTALMTEIRHALAAETLVESA